MRSASTKRRRRCRSMPRWSACSTCGLFSAAGLALRSGSPEAQLAKRDGGDSPLRIGNPFAARLLRRLARQKAAGLAAPEIGIEAALMEERIMRAFLDDATLVHDHEPV